MKTRLLRIVLCLLLLPVFVKYANEGRVTSFFEVSEDVILLGNSHGLSLLDKRTGLISELLSGICRLDPSSAALCVPSWPWPVTSMAYNKRARVQLRGGELAWGTSHGMIAFLPDTFGDVRSDAKIFFQVLTVSGTSIRSGGEASSTVPVNELQTVTIPYSATGFTLELLPFRAPDDAKPVWMLEGFDRTWSAATRNRTITYTDLPPGRFTLEVKLMNGEQSDVLGPRFGKNDFALALHVSPSLLYKKTKALTGLSPVDFIKTVRLNYAMELLRSHRYGVTEVSELCGFSSVGYFSTVFGGHFGQPPSTI